MVDSSEHGLVRTNGTLSLALPPAQPAAPFDAAQTEQLTRFLAWLIPVILGFAITSCGMGLWFSDSATELSAGVIAFTGLLLLIARWLAQRYQLVLAVRLITGSFLGSIVALSVLQPQLAPSHAMVPILIALLVLLYAPNPNQRLLILSCGLTTALVLASGELSPFHSRLPAIIVTILRVSMTMANLIFALLMIVQLRRRLLAAFREAQAGYAALAATHRELHERARYDALTGLLQRGELDAVCQQTLRHAAQSGSVCAVMLLDIDHFKSINDTFGHAAGDLVLHSLGQLVRAALDAPEWACRYGGEEFILVMSGTDVDAVIQRAEKLRRCVQALDLTHQEHALGSITISIGIALYPQHGVTAEELLHAADAVLYQAKRDGRNCVRVAQNVEHC